MLYLRVRSGGSGLWQLHAALGTSATLGYAGRRADNQADPARQFRLGYGYTSLGVSFYPHLLWQKK